MRKQRVYKLKATWLHIVMAFRLLVNRGSHFYVILGVFSENGKLYFCTTDVAFAIGRVAKWSEDVSSCKLQNITSEIPRRSNDWVIEFNALINQLREEKEAYLYYLLCFGYVKEVKGCGMIQIEECKASDKDGLKFTCWKEKFRKDQSNKKGIRI